MSQNIASKESPTPEQTDLLGLNLEELKDFALQQGLPAYTGSQLADWIYHKQVGDFQKMTNLSQRVREQLTSNARIGLHPPTKSQTAQDGTQKMLFPASGDRFVETVLIPDGKRNTLCISSQVGCKMGCHFCMTGKQGFQANLTTGEILNQCLSFPLWQSVSNLVFMGMGEPMDNIENLLKALAIITSPKLLARSPRRITVSTVGIEKGLKRFLEESDCHLAISLHNPFHEERLEMMPVERALPIKELLKLLAGYDFSRQRRLTFEYILFSGLNDSERHARELTRISRSLPCRINLIRFHRIPNVDLPSTQERSLQLFYNYLHNNGVNVTIRESRGEDIDAACGMLSTRQLLETNKANLDK